MRGRTVTETLAEGDVHVLSLRPEEAESPDLLARYQALLSGEERARCARYVFPAGRLQCLLGQALVRTSLSRFADVEPAAWTFEKNPWGRPEISGPAGAPRLRFNLSHADGWLTCVVARDREVGIDVEDITRVSELVEIARRYFSPSEAQTLEALPPERQRARFFEYWTLKESYIKARGQGLSLPLGGFTLLLHEGESPTITFGAEIADRTDRWRFELWHPSPRHTLSVCIERRAGADDPIVIYRHQVVPLA